MPSHAGGDPICQRPVCIPVAHLLRPRRFHAWRNPRHPCVAGRSLSGQESNLRPAGLESAALASELPPNAPRMRLRGYQHVLHDACPALSCARCLPPLSLGQSGGGGAAGKSCGSSRGTPGGTCAGVPVGRKKPRSLPPDSAGKTEALRVVETRLLLRSIMTQVETISAILNRTRRRDFRRARLVPPRRKWPVPSQ